MTTLHTLVLIVHVLVGAGIVGLVLLQRGKGADAGAAFGAGASGTVFGAKGSANFLSRSTAVLATVFFCTSLGLAYLGTQRKPVTSLLDTPEQSAGQPADQAEGQPTAAPVPGEAPVAPPASQLPALPVAPPAAPATPPAGEPAG